VPATICPRCGEPGWVTRERRGGQYYYYCVHVDKKARRRYRCYLGPAEHYIVAEEFNPLGLAGLTDKDRLKRYLKRLLEMLSLGEVREALREAGLLDKLCGSTGS